MFKLIEYWRKKNTAKQTVSM